MRKVYVDFETHSDCELTKVSAERYAEDPSTEILCLCWADDEGWLHEWTPEDGDNLDIDMSGGSNLYEDSYSSELDRLANDPDVIFVANNAAFDQAIWQKIMVERYGYSEIEPERWEDDGR